MKAKHQGKRWECPGKRQREGKQRQRESGQLALQGGKVEDEEEEGAPEEEQWKQLLFKAKRARDPCASVLADTTDALEEAEKKKRLTKESKKDTLAMLEELKHHEKILKQILVKRAKEAMADAAQSIKKRKDEAKECRALANKAGSKASTKRE